LTAFDLQHAKVHREKIPASGALLKYSSDFGNFRFNIPIRYILIKKVNLKKRESHQESNPKDNLFKVVEMPVSITTVYTTRW